MIEKRETLLFCPPRRARAEGPARFAGMGCLQVGVQLNGYWNELVIPLVVRSALWCVEYRARSVLHTGNSQRMCREPLLLSRARVHDMACSLRSAPVLR